jgi:hypothetical protein
VNIPQLLNSSELTRQSRPFFIVCRMDVRSLFCGGFWCGFWERRKVARSSLPFMVVLSLLTMFRVLRDDPYCSDPRSCHRLDGSNDYGDMPSTQSGCQAKSLGYMRVHWPVPVGEQTDARGVEQDWRVNLMWRRQHPRDCLANKILIRPYLPKVRMANE